MKKRLICFLLTLALLFSAAGAELPEAEEEALIHTEFVIERFLRQLPDYHYYDDGADSPYANRVAFFAVEELRNFRYLAVESALDDEGNMRILAGEVLFELETFGSDKPLVIELEMEGYLPRRAFTFEASDGTTRFCYPALSGEYNTPILVPCAIETPDIA